jgi:hypothetical protein
MNPDNNSNSARDHVSMREVDVPGPLLNTRALKSHNHPPDSTAMPIKPLPPSLEGSTGVIRLHLTSDVPIVGTGFSAVISTLCPPGTYTPTGSTIAVPCTPCPAGRYSSSPIGATTCLPCAATAPYSRPHSSSIDACVACTGDVECADGVGAALCPGTAAWVGWSPSSTAPVTGTCLALLSLPMTWIAANSSCIALGPGARLVTSPQVCTRSISCDLKAEAPCISPTRCVMLVVNAGVHHTWRPAAHSQHLCCPRGICLGGCCEVDGWVGVGGRHRRHRSVLCHSTLPTLDSRCPHSVSSTCISICVCVRATCAPLMLFVPGASTSE